MLFHPPLGMKTTASTLLDYWRFHGMLCGPAASRRCVESFARGAIIFMPSSYDPDGFNTSDPSDLLPFEVRKLTLLKYYFLVAWSLTGLSSLLRQTQTLAAYEVGAGPRAQPFWSPPHEPPHPLAVHPSVVDALTRRAGGATAKLVRCFEFRFRLVGLWVTMHHYLCSDVATGEERLHLVEVYQLNRVTAAAWVVGVAAIIFEVMKRLCGW